MILFTRKYSLQRRVASVEYEHFEGFCAACTLPINNGKEIDCESLVIDFESVFFVGTLLLRIRKAERVQRKENSNRKGNENNYAEDGQRHNDDYFENKKRKFQAVITGRFKKSLSMNRCVTGQISDRPAGQLPARWLVKSFIKFISVLAPQLDASLDVNKPRFLTPLLATAQTVLSEDADLKETCGKRNNVNADSPSHLLRDNGHSLKITSKSGLREPASLEPSSVLSCLRTRERDLGISIPDTTLSSTTDRAKVRKKIFNALCATESEEPRFDCNKTYTFEFYQHILEFSQFAVDMGSIGGMIPLTPAMDGQPLKIMAAHRKNKKSKELESLWSFDIFHESLYRDAEMASRQSRDDIPVVQKSRSKS
mmetsp:Transcript_23510/g.55353  ORF Transcript_23510/g.55353 Transcript_23510/m.55353 type:complete len:368 (-) Transcript_23510:1086-2189(-)|eukprot:CAMPEP_0172396162 /NCGR_PEP_ID=MMETSP1061-20121228/24044_1 /TAXON_ID=37318 /ORGANISM="Pseudo-nitzschia pungens, Strain cf. pungens" /LENGTH=367 /DNA_ID=CAMNT_0013127955 /DNA_START=310 /DNA_END=1413 /DNA_ORIENTATION=-